MVRTGESKIPETSYLYEMTEGMHFDCKNLCPFPYFILRMLVAFSLLLVWFKKNLPNDVLLAPSFSVQMCYVRLHKFAIYMCEI